VMSKPNNSTNDKRRSELERLKSTIKQQQLEIVRLKGVIDNLPGSIYWKDINGVYLGNNKFARDKMVDLNLSESVVGKTDYDLFSKEVADEFRKNDLEVMENKCELSREEVTTLADGEQLFQLSRKRPLHDGNDNVVGIVGNTVDITELKHTQDKLRNVEDRLADMLSLIASIAHELRTPLTAIKFGISGIKDYLPALVNAYEVAKEHNLDVEPIQSTHLQILSSVFDNIQSEVSYSETIINMILMNMKQQGVSTANLKKYLMGECIEEAIYRYPFKLNEKKLIICSSEEDFYFFGDKTVMVHILFNLLKNALYYIQAAKKGTIEIWCEKKADKNMLYFKDTGKGIPDDVLPKLFEKFYTTTHHGTGLGLAFCKMVMTSFGGSISCTSEYGKFTQFEMIFPIHKDTA
jgi:PAS domain S-box-containing protein